MKKIVMIAVLMLISGMVHADKRDLIVELLEVTEAQKNHELIIEQYLQSFAADPVLSESRFEEYFRQAMAWETLHVPMIEIYMDVYTEEEIRSLVDFMKSDVGRSFIGKSPEVNRRSIEVISRNIQQAMQVFQQ